MVAWITLEVIDFFQTLEDCRDILLKITDNDSPFLQSGNNRQIREWVLVCKFLQKLGEQLLGNHGPVGSQIEFEGGPGKVDDDGEVPDHGLASHRLVELVHLAFLLVQFLHDRGVRLVDVQIDELLELVPDVAFPLFLSLILSHF